LRQAPYSNFGLPYQTHDEADQESVPAGEPFELTFSLLPTSYRFPAGSRIRITVAFADAGNFDTPVLSPAPSLHLLRDENHLSCMELPIVQSV
jgi:predicted acyl esterase